MNTSFANCCPSRGSCQPSCLLGQRRSTGALINFISICKFAIITIISCEYLTIPMTMLSVLGSRFSILESRISTRTETEQTCEVDLKCIQRMRRGDNEIFNSIKHQRTLPILGLGQRPEISA